jgi:glyoxylase-like metal-dependent hydrolase (beta-lactamase superfamily II)
MDTFTLGEVTITRVVEIPRSAYPTTSMLPEATPAAIARHHGWLKPDFFDESTGDLGSRIQTWVVRMPGRVILIDTGVGNGKTRHESPLWNNRQGTWLDDLAAVGVTPERVDTVVCTHLHVDHVGWNTRREGERWVPTFPNARYVVHGEEWEFWRWETEHGREPSGCIADSVLPVVADGRVDLVGPDARIAPGLAFEPTPGHTPGHVAVRLSTPGGEAVFAGDLMHRTVQVAEPQWNSQFCHDGARARKTREAFVERHADSGVLVLPAHFPRPGFIVRANGGFRFRGPSEPVGSTRGATAAPGRAERWGSGGHVGAPSSN